MILNGKAKDEFQKWYLNKGNTKINFKEYSLDLANAISNALIIEWFESLDKNLNGLYGQIFEYYYELNKYEKKVSEIQLLAIEESNNIYNNIK